MNKKFIIALIALTLTTGWSVPLAEPLNDNNSNIEETMNIDDLREEIQKLDNDIVMKMVHLQDVEEEITDLEESIERDKKSIKATKDELDKQSDLLDSRIRGMYKEGTLGNLNNVLGNIIAADSLKTMFNTIEKMSYITKTDRKLIEKNKKLKEEIEEKLKEAEELEARLNEAKAEQEEELKLIEEYKIKVQEKLDVALEQERIRQEEERRILEELERQREEERRQQEALEQESDDNGPGYGGNNPNPESDNSGSGGNDSNLGGNPAPPADSSLASLIIDEAMKYLGVPYVWGGTTPDGFDCSGLVQYVYGKYGVSLPRVSQDQQYAGTRISVSNIVPGDLIFWGEPAWHVAIYIGNGQYIHAPQTGDVVKISPIDPSRLSSAARVL